MKTLTTGQQTAIASGALRVAWAVKIVGTNSVAYRFTDWDAGATISSEAYSAVPLQISQLPGYAQSAGVGITISIADAAGVLAAAARAGTLRLATVTLFELLGPNLEPLQLMSGICAMETLTGGWVQLLAESDVATWAVVVPDVISPLCRYRSTTQCPFVGSCNKSFANCTTNAKTAIFGGFRYLWPPGMTIEFHDGGGAST